MKQESQKNTKIFLKMLLANDCSKNKIIISTNQCNVIVASLVLWVICKNYKYLKSLKNAVLTFHGRLTWL